MSFAPELFRILAGGIKRQAAIAGTKLPVATVSPGAVGAERYPPDAGALFLVGEKMLLSARHREQALAMLVLQVSDLPELELLFGRRAAEHIVDKVMSQLTRVSAARGFAVRTAPDTFALLMPATTGDQLLATVQAKVGPTCAIELEWRGQEVLLVPDVQSLTLLANQSVREAYQRLCNGLDADRTRERRRRDDLRQERQAHTLPMGLSAGAPTAEAAGHPRAPRHYAPQPATIPLALSPAAGRI